jgi:hypothetical protein
MDKYEKKNIYNCNNIFLKGLLFDKFTNFTIAWNGF